MKGYTTIQDMVQTVMETHPETRDSDYLLYITICKGLNPEACARPFEEVMENRRSYGLPDFDSVSRIRRKVQRIRVDLKASKVVTDGRYENWKEAREYANEC